MTRQEIIEMIRGKYETKESSIIPSDYCYNMTNKGIPEDQHLQNLWRAYHPH